jgi:uncharacterized protein YcaQ
MKDKFIGRMDKANRQTKTLEVKIYWVEENQQ